jgi:hypothetical protein
MFEKLLLELLAPVGVNWLGHASSLAGRGNCASSSVKIP